MVLQQLGFELSFCFLDTFDSRSKAMPCRDYELPDLKSSFYRSHLKSMMNFEIIDGAKFPVS
jgi:hypothetical protein